MGLKRSRKVLGVGRWPSACHTHPPLSTIARRPRPRQSWLGGPVGLAVTRPRVMLDAQPPRPHHKGSSVLGLCCFKTLRPTGAWVFRLARGHCVPRAASQTSVSLVCHLSPSLASSPRAPAPGRLAEPTRSPPLPCDCPCVAFAACLAASTVAHPRMSR